MMQICGNMFLCRGIFSIISMNSHSLLTFGTLLIEMTPTVFCHYCAPFFPIFVKNQDSTCLDILDVESSFAFLTTQKFKL